MQNFVLVTTQPAQGVKMFKYIQKVKAVAFVLLIFAVAAVILDNHRTSATLTSRVVALSEATEALVVENRKIEYKNNLLIAQNQKLSNELSIANNALDTASAELNAVNKALREEQAKGPVDKLKEEPAVVATVKAAERAGEKVNNAYHVVEGKVIASANRIAEWWNEVDFKW